MWLIEKLKQVDPDAMAATIAITIGSFALIIVFLTGKSCLEQRDCMKVCESMEIDQQKLECVLQCNDQ